MSRSSPTARPPLIVALRSTCIGERVMASRSRARCRTIAVFMTSNISCELLLAAPSVSSATTYAGR